MISQSQKISQNARANMVSQVVNIIAQLLLVPLYLAHWSKAMTGEWSVLWTIPSLLWCLEGGLAGIASSKMTVAMAGDDLPLARRILSSTFFLQTTISLFMAVFGTLFLYFTPVVTAMGMKQISLADTRSILSAMLLFLGGGMTLTLCRSVYTACDFAPRGVLLITSVRAGDLVVAAIVLTMGGAPHSLAWLMLIPTSIGLLYSFFDLHARCFQLPFQFTNFHAADLRRVLRDGLPTLGSQLANTLNIQGMTLVVFSVLGPAAVVTMTSVRTISRLALQAVQIITIAHSPEISRSYGMTNFEASRSCLESMLRKTVWIAGFSGLGVVLLGNTALRIWTHGVVRVDAIFLLTFAATILVQAFWLACAGALVATNKHHQFSYRVLWVNGTVLVLAYVLCKYLGILGVPLATICGDLYLAYYVLKSFRNLLPQDFKVRREECLRFPSIGEWWAFCTGVKAT